MFFSLFVPPSKLFIKVSLCGITVLHECGTDSRLIVISAETSGEALYAVSEGKNGVAAVNKAEGDLSIVIESGKSIAGYVYGLISVVVLADAYLLGYGLTVVIYVAYNDLRVVKKGYSPEVDTDLKLNVILRIIIL